MERPAIERRRRREAAGGGGRVGADVVLSSAARVSRVAQEELQCGTRTSGGTGRRRLAAASGGCGSMARTRTIAFLGNGKRGCRGRVGKRKGLGTWKRRMVAKVVDIGVVARPDRTGLRRPELEEVMGRGWAWDPPGGEVGGYGWGRRLEL